MRPFDLLGAILAGCVLGSCFLPWAKFTPSSSRSPQAAVALAKRIAAEEDRSWNSAWLGMSASELDATWHNPWDGMSAWALAETDPSHTHFKRIEQSQVVGQTRTADRLRLIYLAPGAAIFALLFLAGCHARRWPLLLPLFACGGIYALIRWRLQTSELDRWTAGLEAGIGLWLALYALLALSIVLLLRMLLPARWGV